MTDTQSTSSLATSAPASAPSGPRTRRLSAPAAVGLFAAGLLLSGATGAFAATVITGANVKDESLTGKDVKNGSLGLTEFSAGAKTGLKGATGATGATGPAGPQGAQGPQGAAGTSGISGYEQVATNKSVAANTSTSLSLSCPGGKKTLSMVGFWSGSNAAVQTVLTSDGLGGTVYTTGVPSSDTLNIRLVCAVVAS